MSEHTLIIDRLIECRKRIGISKNEASKRIGVSQPAYLRYESGERMPSIQVIHEMARVFHTSSDYLTGKTDSVAPLSYLIKKKDEPDLFILLEEYYQSDDKTKERLLLYLKEFQ